MRLSSGIGPVLPRRFRHKIEDELRSGRGGDACSVVHDRALSERPLDSALDDFGAVAQSVRAADS
jgi:hypothetical protein